MKIKKILFLVVLVGCASKISKKEDIVLKQFQNNGSKFRCQELEEVKRSKFLALFTSRKRTLRKILSEIQDKTNADYYTYKSKGGSVLNFSIQVQPYHCGFKDIKILSGAKEVALFSSDHIVVNCKQIQKVETSYYHDDYKNIYNYYKNTAYKSGANVANLEQKNSGKFVLGLYNCNDKSLAQARINIRKELREKEAIYLKEEQNRIYSNYQEAMDHTLRLLVYRINRSNVY